MTTESPPDANGGQASGARPGLRARLKAETRELHREMEHSGIMGSMLLGRIDRTGYATWLRNLYEVYAGLEAGLETHFENPMLAPIAFRALFRIEHLESDLRQLQGDTWKQSLRLRPLAVDYRDHLNALAREQPGLLAAHAYVRYLYDLTGGQVLYQLIAETLRLGENVTRYFQFGSPGDIDLLVAQFGAGLDTIAASRADEDAIVEEARRAYRRHIELFGALG